MYDLIVIGGGTAGCACAYIAGKLGLKVLLIEKKIHLGGTITSGLVVPVMHSGNNQINTEFYSDLIFEMQNLGGQITYQNNQGWFNPELLKIALDNLMSKVGVEVRFNSCIKQVSHKNRVIEQVYLNNKILSEYSDTIHGDNNVEEILSSPIGARYYVDATGNCEFAKKINCEFLQENEKFQPMSLRFIMSGIDLVTFSKWLTELDSDRTNTTCEWINDEIHLSTAYTWDTARKWALAPLFKKAVQENTLKESDCNYFQIFTVAGMPGSVAFNCPRIVKEYDYDSIQDVTELLKEARQAIFRLSLFCKKYFPGFERAYISNIADEVGVRVSNRIRGKYIYTYDDIITGKKFDNPVVISNYPVDVHSFVKDNSKLVKTSDYQLPIEALMSNDYDNLFVAGRCLSADFSAQGALRVQASCFSMGEAIARYVNSH